MRKIYTDQASRGREKIGISGKKNLEFVYSELFNMVRAGELRGA